MNLDIADKLFVVTGATSGFGGEIAKLLVKEGAYVIINARGEERLNTFQNLHPDKVEIISGDITTDAVLSKLIRKIGNRKVAGLVVNAGGPPAMSFLKTDMQDWDDAYERVLRWKIKLTQSLLPLFVDQKYGRIVYIESASVKQPIENLVLSNSLRLAVVGFVKTLSQEIAKEGITLNILAPGYHSTPAMERLFTHKSMLLGISPEEAKKEYEEESKVGSLGDPRDLASLALWLLSPFSGFVTGQTISVDGGLIQGTMG
jgi:3-oxoacyl-[acyl-carrier protein] reductase